MKNIVKHIILPCFLLLGACSDDFLDTFPPNGASVEAYYQDEEQIRIGLNAAYNSLSAQFGRLYGLGIDAIGMYGGDIALGGRTTPEDYSPIENYTMDGSENVFLVVWRECFQGIYRANIFLEKTEGADFLDPELKARMIAEAKFLRGYFHFELIKVFGDVPLINQVLSPNEAQVGRDPKSAVVAQIIQDFQEAIPDLPQKSEYSSSDIGRVTKGAAIGYLTKIYLYEQRWQDAVDIGIQLIDSKEYDLHEDYFDNFRIENDNGIESIFEVQCKSGTARGVGNAHYDLESFFDTPNPRGYTQPYRDYVDSFQDNADGNADPRKDLTAEFNIISVTLFGSVKYNRPQEDPAPSEQFDGDLNYKLMRYSDFLLLYAEALNEAGQTDQALTYINQVRQRPSVNMTPLTGLNQAETRQAIRDERKWELGCEGHRFFDLVRWGIAGEVIRAQGRSFVDGKHELMPIPIQELDLNPKMTQNPGY